MGATEKITSPKTLVAPTNGGKGQVKPGLPADGAKATSSALENASKVVTRRTPVRSRIAVAQESRLPSRLDGQQQVVIGSPSFGAPESQVESPRQNRISMNHSLSKSESSVKTALPRVDAGKSVSPAGLFRVAEPMNVSHVEASADVPAFGSQARFADSPGVSKHPHSPAASGMSFHPGASTSPMSRGDQLATTRPAGETARPAQPLQDLSFRQLSEGKSRGFSGGASAGHESGILRGNRLEGNTVPEADVPRRSSAAVPRNSGDVEASTSRLGAARVGHVSDSQAVAGDMATTDTRDSISRSRLSAQVLRGIIGGGERKSASTPMRQANASAVPNDRAGAGSSNPLHHSSHVNAASESDECSEMQHRSSFGSGDEASLSDNSGTPVAVHADDLRLGDEHAGSSDAGAFGDDQSLAIRPGEVEWLRTPSLFYFFANIIKWNELQLQRKALLSSLHTRQQHGSRASLSLVSVWTQHRERELRSLESHISFSAFELEGVYLNPVLMSWSKPEIRKLVVDVVATWKKEGSSSAKFDSVSSRLFDAISSEEACQLSRTWVLSVRQWLGQVKHRWIIIAVLSTCTVVSVLCIVFLAVFGRTHLTACIVLSAVLGVAALLMYVIAMFILHHNTYAAAAASFFREAAVRAAQQKLEEEELEDINDLSGVDSYLDDAEGKYGAPGNRRAMDGLTNIDEAESHSDYTAEQTLLAVRNLQELTEGNAHQASSGSPYYRIPSNFHGERRGSGTAAGGYYNDDMTLTDINVPSLSSRPLPISGGAKQQQQEEDRDSALLLSTATFEQRRSQQAGGAIDAPGAVGRANMHPLADVAEKVNITALVYCRNAGVLSEVAPLLWERMLMLLRVTDLGALDSAFRHGSERSKVILIHAADAPSGSEVLRIAMEWLLVKRRPVFFMSRYEDSFDSRVPMSARLKVPFTPAALNAVMLAGAGVEAELGSVSFHALWQQEQSPSHPFQVPPYVLGRRLGGGAFGNVFEAEMEQFGGKCAVKRIYLKEDSDEGGHEEQGGRSNTTANTSAAVSANGELKSAAGDANRATNSDTGEVAGETASNPDVDGGVPGVGSQLRDIAQEVEIMSSLQHPNIVRYYFCERDDNCISIFMELCTGGSLSSLVHSGKLVNPPEIKLLLREIVSAVAYLHSLRIVHRDLKPDNVLFRQGHAKITDFGTAVHKHGGDLRLIKGTFAYMAPETLVGEPYGSACDVWSIGCIAAEVLSVDLPQHALGLPAMCEYYRSMGRDSTLPIECDVPGVLDFLLTCLRRNASERSTAAELFYHPILQARDTSIQTWMQKVVEQRRHKYNLQHKMSHRIGPGGRGNGGPGSVHGVPNSARGSSGTGMEGGDGFDLRSGSGSIVSLDSSRLTGHEDREDSLLSS